MGAAGRFCVKSGNVEIALYSADIIQLDGHTCLLLVSEDMPDSGLFSKPM
jgi:hypothetical protein